MPRLARFQPFALIETNGPILGQVHVIAAIGADRLLKIEIDRKLPSAAWLRFVLAKVPRYVMGFGPPVSIVLNYRTDFAVRHSLDGSVLEVLDLARLPGVATLNTIHGHGHASLQHPRRAVRQWHAPVEP
jgi:hypothetical protein